MRRPSSVTRRQTVLASTLAELSVLSDAQLDRACRVCGGDTQEAGSKPGVLTGHAFRLRHCPRCCFSFVADPWTDYAAVYGEHYYRGEGADPSVDYLFELESPDTTIREYEFRGILSIVQSLVQ